MPSEYIYTWDGWLQVELKSEWPEEKLIAQVRMLGGTCPTCNKDCTLNSCATRRCWKVSLMCEKALATRRYPEVIFGISNRLDDFPMEEVQDAKPGV